MNQRRRDPLPSPERGSQSTARAATPAWVRSVSVAIGSLARSPLNRPAYIAAQLLASRKRLAAILAGRLLPQGEMSR